jgi:hypothetical protein
MAIAAGGRRRPGELSFNDDGDGSVVFTFGAASSDDTALFDAILKRQSTRAEYDGRPVSAADLKSLVGASTVPGIDLVLITDRPQVDRVRDLVIAGNNAQLSDAAFVRELRTWLRFSPREAIDKGDGLFSALSGNPTLPAWLGPHVFDWVFKPTLRMKNMLGNCARWPVSLCSLPSVTTKIIGCAQDARANDSRCRRRPLASSTRSSTNRSKLPVCGRSWRALSACPAAAPIL